MSGLAHMTLAASVLIAATALLRALFLDRLPKRVFTALWLMAALRLLVPWSVPVPVLPASEPAVAISPVYETAPSVNDAYQPAPAMDAAPANTVTAPAAPLPAPVQAAQEDVRPAVDWSWLPQAIWAVGCAAALGYFLLKHLLCLRQYREAVPADDPAVGAILERLRCRRVRVRTAQCVSTPLTYGLFRPVILLPKDMPGDERELAYVLCHELTHIRHLHILYKYVLTAAVCLHWFNPLAWLMLALANRDLELSCDEAVLRAMEGDRTGYAMALISQEARRGLSPLESGFGAKAVKERIVSIMKYRRRSAACLALAVSLVASSAAVFATAVEAAPGPAISSPFITAPPSPTPEPIRYPDITPSPFLSGALAPVEPNGRTELVIGTDAPADQSGLGLLVNAFNNANEDYYATVATYGSQYGWTPMEELPGQLSAGEGPDLLFISGGTAEMAAYGMDLTGLLGQDELSGLLPALGTALARQGTVRCLPVTVALNAFAVPGGTSDPTYTTFTYEEALAMAQDRSMTGNPVTVFESWRRGLDILYFLASAADDFIDYGAGTCDFENDNFTAMLAEAARHPAEYGDAPHFGGNALLRWCIVSNVLEADQDMSTEPDGPPVGHTLTGLPTGGSGVWMNALDVIAVPEGADTEGAAAFLRFALSDAGQLAMQSSLDRGIPSGLPVTVSALETLCGKVVDLGRLPDASKVDMLLALAEGPAGYSDGLSTTFPATAVNYWGGLVLDGTLTAADAAAHLQEDVSVWLQTGVMTVYPDDQYLEGPPAETAPDPAPVQQYPASPTPAAATPAPTPTPPSTVPDEPWPTPTPIAVAVTPEPTPEPTPSWRVDPPDALVGDPPSEDNTVLPPEDDSSPLPTPPAVYDGPYIPDRFPPTPSPAAVTPDPVPADGP